MELETSDPGILVENVGRARTAREINRPQYQTAVPKLFQTIKKLGFEGLRPGQDKAIFNLLMGKDTLCFLPTGAGKSLIYILPTLCLDFKCLIFSPLVSLMKDQVESLWRMNLSAAQISGGQTKTENDMALRAWEAGELQFMLVAPERMASEDFMTAIQRQKPNLVTLDEAHCLSQWGDSFRPAYTRVGEFIDMVNPELVLALTATATTAVEADIRRVLRIPDAHKVVYYPARKNLILSSRPLESTYDVLATVNSIAGPVIVYCPTKKLCEEMFNEFGSRIDGDSLVYHGGLDDGARTTHQELFMANEIRVMFATNAFGLGVNKPDIRGVIHCGFSKSVDTYAQEAGRAGRDGGVSQCVLLHDKTSYDTQMYLIDMNYPNQNLIERVMDCLNACSDADGMVAMTGAEIAEYMGERRRSGQVASTLSILARFGVVERSKDEEPITRVRPLKDNPDKAMQSYVDLIKSIGVLAADGYYEFGLPVFAKQAKLTEKKVKDALTMLDKNGFLQYTRPFKGKTTKIIKDLSGVDFKGLRERKAEEVKKLDALQDYVATADEQKHQFLLDYFGIK